MKIAIFTPGCPPDTGIDWPTRGEGRWSLNWMRVFQEEGHEVHQIHDYTLRTPQMPIFDWYFNSPWFQDQACYTGQIPYCRHAHLNYGALSAECDMFKGVEKEWPQATCIRDGTCTVVFGYTHNLHESLPKWNKNEGRQYHMGNMPIPFSKSMLPEDPPFPFARKGIAWMAKEIFHPSYIANQPYIPNAGIEFLKALVKLAEKAEFVLYYMQDPQYPPTMEAAKLLARLNVVQMSLMRFTDVLRLMSTVKINLAIAGMAACTIDSVFRRAVPLAHRGGFMTRTAEMARPELLLPSQLSTPKVDEIYPVLERLWFDYPFYRHAEECYQADFSDHHKDNALRHFNRFLESVR